MSDVEIGKQYRTEGWIARNRYNRHPRTVQRWQRSITWRPSFRPLNLLAQDPA